jgi:thioredoxin reductase
MYDLIVIGGGPAGLAATAYALDKRLDVLLVGGHIRGKAGIHQQVAGQREPLPLLGELAVEECLRHIEQHPTHLVADLVTEVRKEGQHFIVQGKQAVWYARAVIIATGALPRMLGVQNEWSLVGHGLAYSSTTHARVVDGCDVAVIGATRRALQGAVELLQTVRNVALITPGEGQLTSTLAQRLRAHPRVEVFEGYQVTRIDAENDAVQAIMIKKSGEERRLPVQAVFAAQHIQPNSRLVQELVDLDSDGAILVDVRNQTSVPGLYAAGDVTSAPCESIQIALGDGVRAAVHAYSHILAQRLLVNAETLERGV